MARGWESKSVEQQQAEVADRHTPSRPNLTAAQQRLTRECESLVLARKSLVSQLENSAHARHRLMIEQSLAEIDRQIAALNQGKDQG